MTEPKNNSVRLHRVLKAAPMKVYRAFVEPEALVKWMPPYGYTAKVHSMDARVGGSYRMSFTNFTTQKSHYFGGQYQELKPGELMRYTDKFEDPNLSEEIRVTIRFKEVSCGTELEILQENLPPVIPAELCYLGWQESLSLLALLVEPNIQDS